MQPFRFELDQAQVAEFTERLARSRLPQAAADPQGRLGIPQADLERLRAGFTRFDWPAFAQRLNRHPAFLADLGQPLHFVHQRSGQPDALPLLMLHGWPGSYLEFADLVTPLCQGAPAFHVVCPSLPGYGFSGRSLDAPCNAAAMAAVMVRLMGDLGYERFYLQGGDWGSVIASELARRYPQNCLGLHLNLAAVQPPPEGDPARGTLAAGEAEWLAHNAQLFADGLGYYALQNTRPQTLAVALADSPIGLLAWLGEKYLAWSDRAPSGASLIADQAILEHVALYWLTGSIGSSVRLYYDEAHEPSVQSRVEVPTGVAVFPKELIRTPRAWVEHRFNLVQWTLQPKGGHFAALEVPELLVADVRQFAATVLAGA